MTEYGAGIYLDESLDFSVGNAGDLKHEVGVDELRKDLAIQMIIYLDQYLGRPPTGSLNAEVAGTAMRAAAADTRVQSVDREKTTVSFSPDREEITLGLTVQTDDGEHDLVFEI